MPTPLRTLASAGLAVMLLLGALDARADDHAGAVQGVVTDVDTLKPVADIPVVAVSPALQGEIATRTDATGRYLITGLPPGTYTLRFVRPGATAERPDVRIRISRMVTANVELSSAPMTDPVYTVRETAPGIDVGSSEWSTTFDQNTLSNLPLGRSRTVDEALDLVPLAQRTPLGFDIAGTGAAEVALSVNGLDGTSPAHGLSGTRLALPFVDSLRLTTGGASAEHGRALGGRLVLVTKQGSNEFHGSVFFTVRPGLLEARRSRVVEPGATIQSRQRLGYYMSTGFEVGGPILRDKIWFHAGYAPELQADAWGRAIYARNAGVDSDGNGNPDGPLLAADGNPLTYRVEGEKLTSLAVAHNYHARLSHRISDAHRHSLTFWGSPTRFEGVRRNPFDPMSPNLPLNGGKDTYELEQSHGNLDGIYRYTGRFFDGGMQVDATIGWHHQESIYVPGAGNGDVPLILREGARPLREQEAEVPRLCEPGFDFDDGSSRCVVEGTRSGGFGQGLYQTMLMNRWAERLTVLHPVAFAGMHRLKYGVDFEQSNLTHRASLSGAGIYRQRAAGYFVGQQLIRPDEPDQPLHHLTRRVGSRSYAAFLQDAWAPVPNLTVSYGVRWEGQALYTATDEERRNAFAQRQLGIFDSVAPRIGASWDFLGRGRSRLYAHWGRYVDDLPLDLADQRFASSAARIARYDGTGALTGERCRAEDGTLLTAAEVTDPRAQCPELESRTVGINEALVAPGLQAAYGDEAIVGVEIELWRAWTFSLSGIHRRLGNAIEDIAYGDNDARIVANPGDFDSGAISEIDAALAMESDPAERSRLLRLRQGVSAINELPRARRTFWGLQFGLDKRLAQGFMVRAAYLLSWSRGNYAGLYDVSDPRLSPNSSSAFNLPELAQNRDGPLHNDRRHRFKVDAYWRQNLQDLGIGLPITPTAGAAVRISSGAPIDTLAAHPLYGANQTYLLPRGSAGRTPWLWSLDLHLGARYSLSENLGAELYVDLFNVFNRQRATQLDSTYTYDEVAPVVDGEEADLEHANTVDGTPIRENPGYKQAAAFQPPFSGQLGIRLFF